MIHSYLLYRRHLTVGSILQFLSKKGCADFFPSVFSFFSWLVLRVDWIGALFGAEGMDGRHWPPALDSWTDGYDDWKSQKINI